jgi:hypothetical protein
VIDHLPGTRQRRAADAAKADAEAAQRERQRRVEAPINNRVSRPKPGQPAAVTARDAWYVLDVSGRGHGTQPLALQGDASGSHQGAGRRPRGSPRAGLISPPGGARGPPIRCAKRVAPSPDQPALIPNPLAPVAHPRMRLTDPPALSESHLPPWLGCRSAHSLIALSIRRSAGTSMRAASPVASATFLRIASSSWTCPSVT